MATSTPPRIRPVGSRLCASKVQLVSCLRRKVEKNKSSFIETKNVYECDPWLLVHEPNPLFKKNEWYYFVQRNKRGGITAKRTVPRNGDNEGGTWKTTGKRIGIKDEKKKVVVGYKQSLVYNKNVNGDKVKTDWLMTEFSLNNGGNKEFQELVLCWLRKKKTKEEKKKNVGLSNQEDQEEVDLTGSANQIENNIQGDHGDVLQQQQQQEDTRMMATHNDNNVMMIMPNQEYQEEAGFTGFADELENMMMLEETQILPLPQGENHCLETTWSNMMMLEVEHGDTTQQRQQQETQILPLSQGEIHGFETMTTWSNNNNNIIVLQNQEDQEEAGFSCFSNQQQQQQEQKETPILPLSLPKGESYGSEMTWSNNNNNNIMMMSNKQQYDQWDISYPDDDHDTINIDAIMKLLNGDIDAT